MSCVLNGPGFCFVFVFFVFLQETAQTQRTTVRL